MRKCDVKDTIILVFIHEETALFYWNYTFFHGKEKASPLIRELFNFRVNVEFLFKFDL